MSLPQFRCIVAKKGVPADRVKTLAAALKKAMQTPGWKKFAAEQYPDPDSYMGADEFAAWVAGEMETMREFMKTTGWSNRGAARGSPRQRRQSSLRDGLRRGSIPSRGERFSLHFVKFPPYYPKEKTMAPVSAEKTINHHSGFKVKPLIGPLLIFIAAAISMYLPAHWMNPRCRAAGAGFWPRVCLIRLMAAVFKAFEPYRTFGKGSAPT